METCSKRGCGKEAVVSTTYGEICSKACFDKLCNDILGANISDFEQEKTLEQILEEVKQAGHYGVQAYFGENIGCDDLDVPMEERSLIISAVPVGVLGGARVFWKGNLGKARTFNFSQEKPVEISNPPEHRDLTDDGYYVWGTESALNVLADNKKIIHSELVKRDKIDALDGMVQKFVVFNQADINKYVPSWMLGGLRDITTEIEEGRRKDGKNLTNQYLVINTDESYAVEVASILKRNGHWG